MSNEATATKDRLYRCDVIALARMDFGEADRIVTLYSRDHGKLRAIAKGARRPLSRLGPHLEYFTLAHLMLARGRELDVVTSAETEDAHISLRSDIDAFGHASHMVEILDRLTRDRQANVAVFDLLARHACSPTVSILFMSLAITSSRCWRFWISPGALPLRRVPG